MPVAVPTSHPGKETSWSDKNGRSVMQITNATQMLPSADLMNSADGSSTSSPVWLYTTGVTYFLHFQCQREKLRETWRKPQSKSAMPEKNFSLSAPVRYFPVFSSFGFTTSWCTESRDSCEATRKYDWRPHYSRSTYLFKSISCVPWGHWNGQGDLGVAENLKRCLPGYQMVSPISGHAFVLNAVFRI